MKAIVPVDEIGSDEALMSRVMAGDPSALRPIMDRYYQSLVAYAFRMGGGDLALAEDAIQETFMKVLTQRSYRANQPLRPWLYRVATNCTHDRIRAGRAPLLPLEAQTAGTRGFDERVIADERASLVREAVMKLPWEYRSVIVLRFFHDLSLNEVAEAMSIPLGTVKSRLHEAVRRLRTHGQMQEVES